MSLFGSLFTGVSALTAQSQKTSIISNNIANLNTTGFKRSEATFQSFVTNNSSSTLFSPGTVASERIQRVTEQGPIQQSSSNTDISISGNGFFVTKNATNVDQEFQYTRNGQFSETSEGLLRNAAGQFLYGWRLGENNQLPAGRDDLSSTEPVNVSLQSNNTQPTSEAEFSVNLDRGATGEAVLPASNDKGGIIKDTEANFERGITVFDSQGSPQQLNFSINKTYGPMATANSKPASTDMEFSSQLTDNGMSDNDIFTISAPGGGSKTYGVNTNTDSGGNAVQRVETTGELIQDINNDLDGIDAFLGNEGELIVQRKNFRNGDEKLVLQDIEGGSLQGMGLIDSGNSQVFDASNLAGRNTFTGSVSSNRTGLNGNETLDTLGFSDSTNTFTASTTSDIGSSITDTTQDLISVTNFEDGDEFTITDNTGGNSRTFRVVTSGASAATGPNAGQPSNPDEVQTVDDLLDAVNGIQTDTDTNSAGDQFNSTPGEDFDGLGNVQASIIEGQLRFTQTNGNSLTINDETGDGLEANGMIGDQVSLTDNESGNTAVFTVDNAGTQDVNDLINELETASTNIDGQINSSGAVTFTQNNNNDLTLNDVRGTGLQSTNPGLGLIKNPFANGKSTDSPQFGNEAFPSLQNLPGDTGYNARGWWQVQINDTQGQAIETGLLNFNGNGQLNAQDNDQQITLEQIEWGNGTEPQTINVDISGFSQVDGDFTVNFSDQNGAAVGRRTGVEISQDGKVSARFSNGTTSELFQLPLATFANANGLAEESGTAFTETAESGEENLRIAGEGGAGLIEPGTLENSNVDLADEFSKLIVSQRAYSAGTRVITTIDQMTQELLRIQR